MISSADITDMEHVNGEVSAFAVYPDIRDEEQHTVDIDRVIIQYPSSVESLSVCCNEMLWVC